MVVLGGDEWDARKTPRSSLGYMPGIPGVRAINTCPPDDTAAAPALREAGKKEPSEYAQPCGRGGGGCVVCTARMLLGSKTLSPGWAVAINGRLGELGRFWVRQWRKVVSGCMGR